MHNAKVFYVFHTKDIMYLRIYRTPAYYRFVIYNIRCRLDINLQMFGVVVFAIGRSQSLCSLFGR